MERLRRKEWFWDMQVADTNNYLTEDGTVHHNCGKSTLGCRWHVIRNFWNRHSVSAKSAVVAPTHKQLKHHHLPRYKEALAEHGLKEFRDYSYNSQDSILTLKKHVLGKQYQVFFMSAENWKALVAWEFDHIWWDEPGFGSEELKDFVDQRTGRARGCVVGQVLYTGVVQIANWYYDQFGPSAKYRDFESYTLPGWVENHAPGFGGTSYARYRLDAKTVIMHAASYENPLLPGSYLDRLWEAFGWKRTMFEAHVLGLAVAVNTNAVYDELDEKNTVGDFPVDWYGEAPLDLCFDFNVGQMTLEVCQAWHMGRFAVWENGTDDSTVQDCCNTFLKHFPPQKFGNRPITIYGDHSGWNRTHQFRTRDGTYQIIKAMLQPHFPLLQVKAKRYRITNEIRVMSTNKLMANSRRSATPGLFANHKNRKLISGWRKSSWDPKTGNIAKGAQDDWTHAPEAVDYYLYVEEPPIELETAAAA